MKKFVILFALVAFACAAPISENDDEKKDPIAIVNEERNQSDDGSYKFLYEGSDGSGREETSSIVDQGTDDEAIEITGSYKYIDTNGEEIVVNYTAGKNGFVPVSSVIAKEITENAEKARNLPSQRSEEYENDGPDGSLRAPSRN